MNPTSASPHSAAAAALLPRRVALADTPAQAWRNGGGVTRELLTGAGQTGGDWRWRVSVAEVERDGPFSAFAGVQRWFAVVEGDGVELAIAGQPHLLRPADAPLSFDGADAVDCRLTGGATRDLNLMLRGVAGGMLAIDPHRAWQPPSSTAGGLFTAFDGQLEQAGGHRLALPALTLAWFDRLPDRLQFHGTAQPGRGPGWWLWVAT